MNHRRRGSCFHWTNLNNSYSINVLCKHISTYSSSLSLVVLANTPKVSRKIWKSMLMCKFYNMKTLEKNLTVN